MFLQFVRGLGYSVKYTIASFISASATTVLNVIALAILKMGLQGLFLSRVFYNQCALRPSCYECPYATTERKTDMTIGDFWHIEETIPDFYDPNGNSLFLIHTDRGEELFEKVRDNLDYRLSNTAQCWQANLEAPTQKSEQRDVFWNDYQKKGIDFVIKKYGTVPMKTKVKNKLLKILRGGVRTK